ncbi:MaoC family dehydratase [Chromobacterium violaceum]|uniref:MaoC family dehydratase n=1 Tax=Chromobacterium violaceum TaxID=536 RepID=UPI0009DA4E1C|nr:MaoC family dehydratase [Chromobacterium violaceum]OQS21752.1 hypothetical protein B0T41_20225 [Chromobacterium violaceum]
MLLSFDNKAIADWAKLSGDYNPIHFEVERARETGANDIIVHGMLPLLHIKQRLSTVLPADTGRDWVSVKAMFRSPVLRQLPHALEIQPGKQRSRFSLRATHDASEVMAGSVYRSVPVESPEQPASFSIDRQLFREKRAVFAEAFPDFDRAWLLVDALTFSQFLSSEVPFSIVRDLAKMSGIASQHELMDAALTVQTAHTVMVEPELFRMPLSQLKDPGEIRCELHAPVTVPNSKDTLSGLSQFTVRLDGRPVMQSEVGLLVRFKS